MPKGAPAIIATPQRPGLRASVVGREIKMLRPICSTCQRKGEMPADWWKTCPHSKYVSLRRVEEKVPKYEELPDGRQKLIGTDTLVNWVEEPNWVQVSALPRLNGNRHTPEFKHRVYGFIMPEELVTPTFPNGIKNCCEFRECFVQEGLKEYTWGRYCRKREAQLVGHDIQMSHGGGALEIYSVSEQSLGKQERQLNEVPV